MIDPSPPTLTTVHPRRVATIAAVSSLALLLIVSRIEAPNGWWDAALLGVIEGVTEFLPVSSTGHLLLASRLLGFEHGLGGTFEIFIQLGAVLAVVVYYARDLWAQARAFPSQPATRHFWLCVLAAFLPAALVGLLLHDWIKRVVFASPAVIGWSLLLGGIVLWLADRVPVRAANADLTRISLRQALGVGLAQVCALVPGVSRSGASIVGGLLGGLDRSTATTFSFYLAIPTLGAATIVDLLGSRDLIGTGDLGRLLIGTAVAFVVAWLSIDWLLRFVATHSFRVFAIYRICAGAVVMLLVALRWL